jgi:hypothetical protein
MNRFPNPRDFVRNIIIIIIIIITRVIFSFEGRAGPPNRKQPNVGNMEKLTFERG